MGLIDVFTADTRVELKVGDLYDVLRVAASNKKNAEHLMNAVKCEVPYRYIREIMTGKKEEEKTGALCIETSRDILDEVFKAAQSADTTKDTEINAACNTNETASEWGGAEKGDGEE